MVTTHAFKARLQLSTLLTIGALWLCISMISEPVWALPEDSSNPEMTTFVSPILSDNAQTSELEFLDDVLVEALAAHSNNRVISSDDIQALVQHREQEQLLGCIDDSCGRELAQLVGSRFLIRAKVHAVGESFHILLTRLDSQNQERIQRSRASGLRTPDEQVRAVQRAARRLFGIEDSALTLEEVVHAPVISGSRVYESSLMAPAWNITLTGAQLRARGYVEFSELFDDLPGIDVARPRGASWLRTYWRGRRDTWQDHFLFLIDGIPWHDHLYGNARMHIPLSNIERVEVFYGPGSLMHGANALMGVVQVITKRELNVVGTSVSGHVGTMAPERRLDTLKGHRQVADVHFKHVASDYQLSIATRFDHGRLDTTFGNEYEWTRYEYYDNPEIWGDAFLEEYDAISGRSASPYRHLGADLRLDLEDLEIGVQYYQSERGTGYQFAADRYQNQAIWSDIFYNAFIRTEHQHGPWSTNVLVRHRGSRWPDQNSLLYRSGSDIYLQRFVSNNTSTEIHGTANYQFAQGQWSSQDRLSLITGATLGLDDLGRDWARDKVNLTTDDIGTDQALSDAGARNRVTHQNLSGFALAKYLWSPNQRFDLGMRREFTRGKTSDAFRLAYVGRGYERWTWKVLFGRAFAMPVPRQLTFVASTKSNENLKAEETTSLEAGLYYNDDSLSIQVSPYVAWNDNVIDVINQELQNASTQEIFGIDAGLIKTWQIDSIRTLRTWLYTTWLPLARQDAQGYDCSEISFLDHLVQRVDTEFDFGRQCQVGDVSRLKLWAGAEMGLTSDLNLTLLGRFYSARPTVASNPISKVSAYGTLDLSINSNDFIFEGLQLGFRVTNLLNTLYFHPGVNGANAGDTPGSLQTDDTGTTTWVGSNGSYTSLMPQPSRTFQVTLGTTIE